MIAQTWPAATWRTSSYSINANNCVEVAHHEADCAVRDTKDRAHGTLTTTPAAWRSFLSTLR